MSKQVELFPLPAPTEHGEIATRFMQYVAHAMGGRFHVSKRGVPLAIVKAAKGVEASVTWFHRSDRKGRRMHTMVVRHPWPSFGQRQQGEKFICECRNIILRGKGRSFYEGYYPLAASLDPVIEQIEDYLKGGDTHG